MFSAIQAVFVSLVKLFSPEKQKKNANRQALLFYLFFLF